MSTWSCPHQTSTYDCLRVGTTCHPGMKGCVLRGKVRFVGDVEFIHEWEDLAPQSAPPSKPPEDGD